MAAEDRVTLAVNLVMLHATNTLSGLTQGEDETAEALRKIEERLRVLREAIEGRSDRGE